MDKSRAIVLTSLPGLPVLLACAPIVLGGLLLLSHL